MSDEPVVEVQLLEDIFSKKLYVGDDEEMFIKFGGELSSWSAMRTKFRESSWSYSLGDLGGAS